MIMMRAMFVWDNNIVLKEKWGEKMVRIERFHVL